MIFSTVLFLFYFLPIFLLAYHFTPIKHRNITALIGSIIFYIWGAPVFIFILLGSCIIDYYITYNFDKYKKPKLLLIISLILNIGMLAYFKYANFFVDNLNAFLSVAGFSAIKWIKVGLPIGISFFTFQKISYSIDIYRKRNKPLDSVSDYILYIILFPQLIAGPIIRFNEIAEQIRDRRKNETYQNKLIGFYRFIIGLSKKVLIANSVGAFADTIFNAPPESFEPVSSWIATLAYTIQIYFDFSGYSDMAIGIGRMLGFRFPENFNNPYTSKSITEFWR